MTLSFSFAALPRRQEINVKAGAMSLLAVDLDLPPWPVTMPKRGQAQPVPLPISFVVKKGSKTLASSCRPSPCRVGDPDPYIPARRQTEGLGLLLIEPKLTECRYRLPPPGMACEALTYRLRRTCSIWFRSTFPTKVLLKIRVNRDLPPVLTKHGRRFLNDVVYIRQSDLEFPAPRVLEERLARSAPLFTCLSIPNARSRNGFPSSAPAGSREA